VAVVVDAERRAGGKTKIVGERTNYFNVGLPPASDPPGLPPAYTPCAPVACDGKPVFSTGLTTFQLLGIQFGVSESTANDIFNYWLPIRARTVTIKLT
jgi:hypothetical protein